MNKRNLLCILMLLLASSLMYTQKINTEILTGMDNSKIVGDTIQLERETYNAFFKMKDAAEKDGIRIKLVSGFRDFYRQQTIWNNKYKKFTKEFSLDGPSAIKEIIRFSTIPGTSRHHWGTEIDIIDKNIATGPGVIDAKGGCIILLNVLKNIENSNLPVSWTAIFNSDEEIGTPY